MAYNFSVMNNMEYMMNLNSNFVALNKMTMMVNNRGVTNFGFSLQFKVIPQNWDGTDKNTFPINLQVIPNYSVKQVIDKFYQKLVKPREAIIKFSFNNIELDTNSEQKLIDLNINEYTIIYALKSLNFDELKLS